MASIEIRNASVSYFLKQKGKVDAKADTGAGIGAPIVVRQKYIEIEALRDISLSFRDGDRVGLIGINGSGKSTLLKLCAGALVAKDGSVEIEGKISPQFALGAGIKPNLTGRRNAELKCLYMGTPQGIIASRIEDVKRLSDLGAYFELPVRTYSAGMRSRLVMSLMRLVRADILVMDEWIGAADASVNKTISALQTDLIESSSILILASHSQRILMDWAKSLVWLHRGRVRKVGPATEIYDEYKAWMASRQ